MAAPFRSKAVFNIEAAGISEVGAMQSHEKKRDPDGSSAIDPLRTHLNEVLHGLKAGPSPSLNKLWKDGVQKPDDRAEKPFLRIVLSASPQFFRPGDPEAAGKWDDRRLELFKKRTMQWLKREFGDDLVYASIHLDEDTPHIHALVVPTCTKKPRTPGKQKRNETEVEFEARKQAARDAEGVRIASRSSHPKLSKKMSFDTLRREYCDRTRILGIDYGDPATRDAEGNKVTRKWVDGEAKKLIEDRQKLDQERADFETEKGKILDEARAEAGAIIDNARAEAAKIEAVQTQRAANLDTKEAGIEAKRKEVQAEVEAAAAQRLGQLARRVRREDDERSVGRRDRAELRDGHLGVLHRELGPREGGGHLLGGAGAGAAGVVVRERRVQGVRRPHPRRSTSGGVEVGGPVAANSCGQDEALDRGRRHGHTEQGFERGENAVHILGPGGVVARTAAGSKREVAAAVGVQGAHRQLLRLVQPVGRAGRAGLGGDVRQRRLRCRPRRVAAMRPRGRCASCW